MSGAWLDNDGESLESDLGSGALHAGEPRHGREHALAGAEGDVLLEPGRPVRPGVQPVERARDRPRRSPLPRRRRPSARRRAAARSGPRSRRRRARTRPCSRRRGSPRPPRARAPPPTTASRLSRLPISTSSQRSAAVTIVRVPFVVERISVPACGSRNSRGEAPTSKPSIRTASRSPPTMLSGSSARSARACSISAHAEHALVPGRERLRDRRGRAEDVDRRSRSGPPPPRPV